MPPELDLELNCRVVFEAIDATTGAPVSGVLVDNPLIRVEVAGAGTGSDVASGPFMLVPGPAA